MTVNSAGSATHDTNGWMEGDEIHIDLTQLDVSSALDWSGTSTVISNLLTLGVIKGHVIDMLRSITISA